MREADKAIVTAALGQLSDERGEQLALLAQVLTKGIHATLLVFASAGYCAAFDRAWADSETSEIILRMAPGGRQPITFVESRTRYVEGDRQGA